MVVAVKYLKLNAAIVHVILACSFILLSYHWRSFAVFYWKANKILSLMSCLCFARLIGYSECCFEMQLNHVT